MKRFMLIGGLIALLLLTAAISLSHCNGWPSFQPAQLTILTADGRPAADAVAVSLPPRNIRAYVFSGDVNPGSYPDSRQYQSDASGILRFNDSIPLHGIVVFHAQGYVELNAETLERNGKATLQPWARIRGQLFVGHRPAANQTVQAQMSYKRYGLGTWTFLYFIKSQTDVNGRFVLDRVPNGTAIVGRFLGGELAQEKQIDLSPGQTASVSLGGMGRAVVGEIEIPSALVERHDWIWDGRCTLAHIEQPPEPPMPDFVRNGTRQQRHSWMADFRKSDEGKIYSAKVAEAIERFRSYPVEIKPNGSFRVEDVSAGTYELTVGASQQTETKVTPLATGAVSVDVPAMPSGRTDEPLTIPPIAMRLE